MLKTDTKRKQKARADMQAWLQTTAKLHTHARKATSILSHIRDDRRWQATIDYFLDEELPGRQFLFDGQTHSRLAAWLLAVLPISGLIAMALDYAGTWTPAPWPSAQLWNAWCLAPPERNWARKSVTRANNMYLWLAQLNVWPYLMAHKSRLFAIIDERQNAREQAERAQWVARREIRRRKLRRT